MTMWWRNCFFAALRQMVPGIHSDPTIRQDLFTKRILWIESRVGRVNVTHRRIVSGRNRSHTLKDHDTFREAMVKELCSDILEHTTMVPVTARNTILSKRMWSGLNSRCSSVSVSYSVHVSSFPTLCDTTKTNKSLKCSTCRA